MLEKTMRINDLFDFYSMLLTPKQREYMTLYYLEDYSLAEISNYANVSRQAVYDNLKRTEGILEAYEEKLKLYEKFNKRSELLSQLKGAIVGNEDQSKALRLIEELKELG